jgi:flagellar hook-associated protein 1 FlgK
MGMLNTGITGLNAFRSQLTTTSHNIANVNTEGYSRQIVGLGTLPATNTSLGAIGNGVQINDIRRQFDQFLMDRLRTYTSSDADFQIYYDRAARVDDVIADPDAGISRAMQDFFNSIQDVADNPTSTATRDVLLSNANILTDRFHSVHSFLEGLRTEINQDMQVLVGEANSLAESIANLNKEIQIYMNSSGGNSPNDLLDRRDQVITQLSELVNITAVGQSDGTVNVFIGNGQGIVIGARSFALGTEIDNAEPDRIDITLEGGGGAEAVITNFLSGGKFGGYLRFRQEILDPTENAIGRLALGLGTLFNEQHKLGMDLNGALGNDFFDIPSYSPLDLNGQQLLLEVQTGGTAATITNINVDELDTADYEVTLDTTGTSWAILNRETGAIQNIPTAANITFGGANDSAITLDVTGAVAGDQYIVRPTRIVGRAIEVNINDVREIAAASPVAVFSGDASGGPATVNTGTSQLIDGRMTTVTGTIAASELVNATGITLDYIDNAGTLGFQFGPPASTVPAAVFIPYTVADSGTEYTVEIAGLGDFTFTLSGDPDLTDSFTLKNNIGGVGDNRNALSLAQLQTRKTMLNDSTVNQNPTTSFVGLYSGLIGQVGTDTRQALISSNTQTRLKEQAETALDEVVGVNLDEEAANLVHFQQAYQAAAQVIRVSNQLFDTLLAAF